MKLQTIHVIEAFGKKADGVAGIVRMMAEQLSEEIEISIAACNIQDNFAKSPYHVTPLYLPQGKLALRGANRTRDEFCHLVEKLKPDIIHLHGVFSPLQRITLRVAKHKGIPTILSPHGMLEPWLWHQKGWLYHTMKRTFWRFIIYPTLSKVDYVHAITPDEGKTITKEFPHHPQIQIPNAIDLKMVNSIPSKKPERLFVFLGRVHPKKGVSPLIHAFKRTQLAANWRLLIAGPDFSPVYGKELRQLVADLGLRDRVEFIGPVFGDEKFALLAKAWVVVVPSYSEVIALVNLESAAVNTPTITTTGTGLHDWAESGGLLIDADIDQLSQALQNASNWNLKERQSRGQQAYNFVQERYSWQTVGLRWIEAYHQIAEN